MCVDTYSENTELAGREAYTGSTGLTKEQKGVLVRREKCSGY